MVSEERDGIEPDEGGIFRDEEWQLQRLVRHISCVEIKNLTPFPVRDAFASALSQPSEQSQFTAFGNLSDDLDVALARKRPRKISTTSVGTVKSSKHEHASSEDFRSHDLRGRKRTLSRPTALEEAVEGDSPTSENSWRPTAISGTGPTIRPHRARTTSMVSNGSHNAPSALLPSSSSFFPDNSQKTLENVIQSRLVETFISITVPPPPPPPASRSHTPNASPHPFSVPRTSSPDVPSPSPPHSAPASRDKFPNSQSKSHTPSPSISRRSARASSSAASSSKSPISRHQPSTSVRSLTSPSNARGRATSGPIKANGVHAKASASASHIPYTAAPSLTFPSHPQTPSAPDYLSPVHAPSINPSFPLDPQSGYEFAPWTDLTASSVILRLWAKVGTSPANASVKGKDKQTTNVAEDSDPPWKLMEEWTIRLSELIPLPEQLAEHPSHLPPNTVLIHLSPPGKTFYLPPPIKSALSSRSPSPSAGYASEPEVRGAGESFTHSSFAESSGDNHGDHAARSANNVQRPSRLHHDTTRSAGWQDLVKLVTLQSVVVDTQRSLQDVVREIDNVIAADETAAPRREISEREARVAQHRADTDSVRTKSESLSACIAAKRDSLRRRRELLTQARQLQNEASSSRQLREEEIVEERSRVQDLHNRIRPVRITLVSALAAIFPIDLLSGPDLLYTILQVPLPIPLGATDPAPPLSLPSHKEVTEDAVATALGYAALVVQLLAVYLNKGLVYPITYVGSKSLIRDGISAMVGPRMFPLFSKGVDTYRFEYGVFLLNKDIELLMSERNLRALDMRHTLPNLKNLLLTLTDGEGAQLLTTSKSLASPASSVSGLETPSSRPSSPVPSTSATPQEADASTPKASAPPESAAASSPGSAMTLSGPSPSSASSSASDSYASLARMSKPFFGLSGFLRSRYPSSSQQPSVKAVPEVPEGEQENGRAAPGDSREDDAGGSGAREATEDADEDTDSRTVRGLALDDAVEEHKELADGDAVAPVQVHHEEKRLDAAEASENQAVPQVAT